ncbi:MAG: zf-TFIIB domain-containing protein [Candidatus Eiseniibacteriota bacterium]
MRLVACPSCRAHFDVTAHAGQTFACSCGATVSAGALRAVDAPVRRCGSCGALLPENADACAYCRARVTREGELSLICPECYARNSRESRFCTACGVEFRPQPLPEPAKELGCVRCGTPMLPRQIAGVLVRECSDCHGLWIPGDRFDRLVERAVESWEKAPESLEVRAPRRTGGNPATERIRYRKCPECTQTMDRRNWRRTSGVIIDRCHEHGTWLDADELERIAGFIKSGGLERAKAAEETTMKVPPPPRDELAASPLPRSFVEHRPVGHRQAMIVDSVAALLSRLIDRLR